MRGKAITGLLIVSVALSGAGCTPGTADQPPLEETGWVLSAYGEPGEMKLATNHPLVTLAFEEDEVRGSAGCNTYSGSYTYATGGELHITGLRHTEAYCTEEGVMEQEETFLETLRLSERYGVDARTLTISGGGRVLILLNNCLCSD